MRAVLKGYAREPERFKIRRPAIVIGGRPNPFYKVWETLLLHSKARDVQTELEPEVFTSFYKFAFVRNPWDLMVSMYHFILREPEAARHAEVKALGSFDAFLEWVVKTPDPFPRGITKTQREMLTDPRGNLLMDFVGHYETLEEDFAHVCSVLQIENTLPHLNRTQHQDYRTYYNQQTERLVGEHFRPDVESFGYTFDGSAKPRHVHDS